MTPTTRGRSSASFARWSWTGGISVVAATHDSTLLAMADSVKEMRDGSMVEGTAEARRYRN